MTGDQPARSAQRRYLANHNTNAHACWSGQSRFGPQPTRTRTLTHSRAHFAICICCFSQTNAAWISDAVWSCVFPSAPTRETRLEDNRLEQKKPNHSRENVFTQSGVCNQSAREMMIFAVGFCHRNNLLIQIRAFAIKKCPTRAPLHE